MWRYYFYTEILQWCTQVHECWFTLGILRTDLWSQGRVLMFLFKSTGEPLLTDDFDKWTLIHGPSDLNTEFSTKSSPVSESDIKTLPFKQPQAHRASAYKRFYYIWYDNLVFTKSVNSNFRLFWLAPVTRNILGYSLFCDRSQMASRLQTFSEDGIWAINEIGVQRTEIHWYPPLFTSPSGDTVDSR